MTANPMRGEVSLDIEGETYTLLLDFNAICVLQDRTGIGTLKLAQLFFGAQEKGELLPEPILRSIFWAGLSEHHPGLDERDAGRLLGRYGLLPAVTKIGESISACYPRAEDAKAIGGPRKAPTAKRPPASRKSGSSRRSTRNGAG